MTLITKYDIRHRVWIMIENKPEEVEIHDITVAVTPDAQGVPVPTICYRHYGAKHGLSNIHRQDLYFPTKEELIASL
jgi:hypothetical protein